MEWSKKISILWGFNFYIWLFQHIARELSERKGVDEFADIRRACWKRGEWCFWGWLIPLSHYDWGNHLKKLSGVVNPVLVVNDHWPAVTLGAIKHFFGKKSIISCMFFGIMGGAPASLIHCYSYNITADMLVLLPNMHLASCTIALSYPLSYWRFLFRISCWLIKNHIKMWVWRSTEAMLFTFKVSF